MTDRKAISLKEYHQQYADDKRALEQEVEALIRAFEDKHAVRVERVNSHSWRNMQTLGDVSRGVDNWVQASKLRIEFIK